MDSQPSTSRKLTNAEKCKRYRKRKRLKKAQSPDSVDFVKRPPLTNAERCKRYRERVKKRIVKEYVAVVPPDVCDDSWTCMRSEKEINRNVNTDKQFFFDKLDDYCRICDRVWCNNKLIKLKPDTTIYDFVKSLKYYEVRDPFMVCSNCFKFLRCKIIPSLATVYPEILKDLPVPCLLSERFTSLHNLALLQNIKVKEGIGKKESCEFGLIKVETTKTEISVENIAQDGLLENIKIENTNEQLDEDVSNTKNCELANLETIKVEKCVKNENVLMLQKDPLSEDYQTQVTLDVKEELGLKGNQTHSTKKKSNGDLIFCKECNKTVAYRYYTIHARIHAGNTPFKCDVCEKAFVTPTLLKKHKVAHSEIRPYSCKICKKCFKWKKDCIGHERVHSGNRPFPCDQCDKSFQYYNRLKAHKVSHRIDRNVSCEQCGKFFKGKMRLYQHIRSAHLVKKVHICSYCGMTFSQKNGLRSHIKTHTGEKPYTCEVCKKSFAWSSLLHIHMRVHTWDRPYSCELCPANFKCSQNLTRHMKVHIKKEVVTD